MQRGVVLSTTSATGTLQAAKELNVGFTTAGTITSIAVKPGERVAKGQLLGRIDSTSAQQALQQAEASLATAQAQYEQTLTGETAQQRRQDALSITQAKQSLANAKATQRQDRQQSTASVAQPTNALRADQGQEKVDLYQQTKDRGDLSDGGGGTGGDHGRPGSAGDRPVEAAVRRAAPVRPAGAAERGQQPAFRRPGESDGCHDRARQRRRSRSTRPRSRATNRPSSPTSRASTALSKTQNADSYTISQDN